MFNHENTTPQSLPLVVPASCPFALRAFPHTVGNHPLHRGAEGQLRKLAGFSLASPVQGEVPNKCEADGLFFCHNSNLRPQPAKLVSGSDIELAHAAGFSGNLT
jgi:hypothetical protein